MLPLRYTYLYSNSIDLQEQNTVPSLRKALKDVAMEKDAAVVARVWASFCIFCYMGSLTCSFYDFLTVCCSSIGGPLSPTSHAQETPERGRR